MARNNTSIVATDIVNSITRSLDQVGVMFRVFYRVKDIISLEKKIESKSKYFKQDAKMQDLIGVRIVLYFPDDIKIVHKIIGSIYYESSKDNSIDEHGAETFAPLRYNIIYQIPELQKFSLDHKYSKYIDNTFELQIRTVFSEGWHEVEHDLRFKYESDWDNNIKESRLLNGVYAALETNEWMMIKIFDELAYKHYKDKKWESMFRQYMRLRIQNFEIDDELKTIFDTVDGVAKDFFRIDRVKLLEKMFHYDYHYPLTLQNIIYFANEIFVHCSEIEKITPKIMLEDLRQNL